MKGVPLLAWRSLAHHPVRSGALVLGVALTVFLPLSVDWLVARYGTRLRARAEATPLVLGAPGSRFDLVLGALYFRGAPAATVTLHDAQELAQDGLAVAIPVFQGARGTLSAAGHPLVGVAHEYYAFRGLACASGTPPLRLGDCVLGHNVARELSLGPGDALLSDRESLFDLSRGYPLRMHVRGVLAPTDGPDDDAVFCDVRTAWLAAGIGHGHAAAEQQSEQGVLRRDGDGRIVLNASIVEYVEVGPDNEADFHFHGEPEELPLGAVLALPRDDKARTILKARYRVRDDLQLAEPRGVMEELLGLVLRVKAFFDAASGLALAAAAVFLGVVTTLLVAVRARERRTLFKLGAARGTVLALIGTELGLVLLAGVAVAALSAWSAVELASRTFWKP